MVNMALVKSKNLEQFLPFIFWRKTFAIVHLQIHEGLIHCNAVRHKSYNDNAEPARCETAPDSVPRNKPWLMSHSHYTRHSITPWSPPFLGIFKQSLRCICFVC